MYPSRRSVHNRQTHLTIEQMLKDPENFTFAKCEKLLQRFNEYYVKDEPKLLIYIIHDKICGYSGDLNFRMKFKILVTPV